MRDAPADGAISGLPSCQWPLRRSVAQAEGFGHGLPRASYRERKRGFDENFAICGAGYQYFCGPSCRVDFGGRGPVRHAPFELYHSLWRGVHVRQRQVFGPMFYPSLGEPGQAVQRQARSIAVQPAVSQKSKGFKARRNVQWVQQLDSCDLFDALAIIRLVSHNRAFDHYQRLPVGAQRAQGRTAQFLAEVANYLVTVRRVKLCANPRGVRVRRGFS